MLPRLHCVPPLHAELPGCLGTLGPEEAELGPYPWGCADGVMKEDMGLVIGLQGGDEADAWHMGGYPVSLC